MKYNYTIKSLLLIFAMIMSVCGAWAETTYKLEQVNNVVAGELYVFVQAGHAMAATITSSALQTVDDYETTGLTGEEVYIWTLESATGGYKMKNVYRELDSDPAYLRNANSTSMSFGASSAASIWSFDFTNRNAVVISNTSNNNRFLGFTSASSYAYKAYAAQNLSNGTNTHNISVYVLVKETGGPTKTLSSIAVSGTPSKTTYDEGDPFEVDGLTVTGTYSDASTEDLTDEATWSITPSEGLPLGTTSVSVTATVGEVTSAAYTVNGLTVNKYPYIKDKLTQAVTGVTDVTYKDFSGKTIASDAVYAGNCAGSNSSVQLRTKDSNSGVISTTSGGYIRKVSVEWNSSTAAGRVLDVYGSDTPYTSAADLYATNTRGTKLGSITNGTSTSLTITGDYKYVGIRSNEGAMYLTSVTFEWEEIPVCPVTFRKAGKGYSTLFTSESALTIPEDVEAYYCTLKDNGNMEPHALTSVIPASTPVVLHYTGELTADKTINFAYSTEEGEDASANVLRGTDEALDITSITDNDFYVLSIVDGQVGFYKFGGDELAAGKAYYVTAKAPAGGDFTYEFHDEYVTVTPPAGYEGDYFVSAYSAAMLEIMTLQELVDDDVYFYFDMLTFNGALDIYYTEICFNDGDEYTLYISKRDNDGLVGTPVTCQFVINDHKQLVSHASTRGFILDFGFDGTTTGVSNVQTIAPAAKASFDLQGRRVMGNAKGLLIKNGRVMLNR